MFKNQKRHLSRLVKWILTLLIMLIPAAMTSGQDFEAVHKRFKKMVKKGELKQVHADAMLETLERMVEGQRRQRERDMVRRRLVEFEEMQEHKKAELIEIAGKLRRAVKNGDMSEQEAKDKLAAVQRELYQQRGRDRDEDRARRGERDEDVRNRSDRNRVQERDRDEDHEYRGERDDDARNRGERDRDEDRDDARNRRDRNREQERERRSEQDEDARHRNDRNREHERENDREHERDGDRERSQELEKQAEKESAQMQLFKLESAFHRLKNALVEIREGRIEAQVRLNALSKKRNDLNNQKAKQEADLAKVKEMLEDAESTGSINRNGREYSTTEIKSAAKSAEAILRSVQKNVNENESLAEVWEKNLAIKQQYENVTLDKLKEYEARINEFRTKQAVENTIQETEAVRERIEEMEEAEKGSDR